MGRTMEINPGGIYTVIAAVLGGGVVGQVLRFFFRREGRSNNTDYWYDEVQRLTGRVDEMEKTLAKVQHELERAQQEALFWRGQFYDEAISHKETRHTFTVKLMELKEKGRVTISDIERIYTETQKGQHEA